MCFTCSHLSEFTYRDGSWCRMCALSMEVIVRGYHAHKDIWAATIIGEQGNAQDIFAVAVLKDGFIIGHVLQKISAACSVFLCVHLFPK